MELIPMLTIKVKRGSTEMVILALVGRRPRHGCESAEPIEERLDGVLQFTQRPLSPALPDGKRRVNQKHPYRNGRSATAAVLQAYAGRQKALNEQRERGRIFRCAGSRG